jgi:hypothetical protein
MLCLKPCRPQRQVDRTWGPVTDSATGSPEDPVLHNLGMARMGTLAWFTCHPWDRRTSGHGSSPPALANYLHLTTSTLIYTCHSERGTGGDHAALGLGTRNKQRPWPEPKPRVLW